MRRRVKITGIGPVTPAGIGRDNFLTGIGQPISRTRVISTLGTNTGPVIGADIPGFDLSEWVPINGVAKKLPRQTQFAMAAAALALRDAKIDAGSLTDSNPVVVIGSSLMDPELTYRTIANVLQKGPRLALPSVVFDAPPSAVAGRVAALVGPQSRTMAIQSACCAGLDAIGFGADMIATGQAEVALCGGTEAPIFQHPMIELAMVQLSARNVTQPTEMGRPFDLWRNVGVIGEGACVVILEAESSHRPALAWIQGYAFGNDGPGASGNGLAATMKMALANAACLPARIDLINAWGPGHLEIDREEARTLIELFGADLAAIPAVSIKGAIGNALGAAGAIQVGSTVLSLSTGRIPPTVNWCTPDIECPLNLSRSERDVGCKLALVNAHGLSGTNASLVISRA